MLSTSLLLTIAGAILIVGALLGILVSQWRVRRRIERQLGAALSTYAHGGSAPYLPIVRTQQLDGPSSLRSPAATCTLYGRAVGEGFTLIDGAPSHRLLKEVEVLRVRLMLQTGLTANLSGATKRIVSVKGAERLVFAAFIVNADWHSALHHYNNRILKTRGSIQEHTLLTVLTTFFTDSTTPSVIPFAERLKPHYAYFLSSLTESKADSVERFNLIKLALSCGVSTVLEMGRLFEDEKIEQNVNHLMLSGIGTRTELCALTGGGFKTW